MNSILKGEVTALKQFGAFVKIPGHHRNGLVHISQLSQSRVEEVSDVVRVGSTVWCKVISVDSDCNKVGLSMKVVQQSTGKDLDPNGVQTYQDDKRRRSFSEYSTPRITLDAVYNTTCRRCGTKGHLAQDCFQVPGGRQYGLISGSDSDDAMPPTREKGRERSNHSSKSRGSKKEKKHKRQHKPTRGKEFTDSDSSSEPEKRRRQTTKMKRQHSSSSDVSNFAEASKLKKRPKKEKHGI